MPSLISLFTEQRRTKIQQVDEKNITRDLILIDAAVAILHQSNADVTEHKVEDNSTIGDHVEMQPLSVTITGVISETPITLLQAAVGNVAGAIGGIVGGALGGAVTGVVAGLAGSLLQDSSDRVNDHYNTLLGLQQKKIPVTIVTSLTSYTNMILTSLSVNRTATTGRELAFTSTFREIRIVESQTIELPGALIKVGAKGQRGNQTATEANEAETTRSASFLKIGAASFKKAVGL